MSKPIHPVALFRLSVLGPLTNRQQLARGELKAIIKQLAKQTYNIPSSKRMHISAKTIERWYYAWLKKGIDGLAPTTRKDKGSTQLSSEIQTKILAAKRDHPARSIPTLIQLLEARGDAATDTLSHSTVHRFLQQQSLSTRTVAVADKIERRAFEALYAGDIWYGDVMHGPVLTTENGKEKTYLVSVFDDASRLVCHSKFCLGETAIVIEYVLKEALLKRGLPIKFVVDNGPAYRSKTLQSICARLNIRLIYGRPYEPQSKGKLERWHRTVREKFLSECCLDQMNGVDQLNSRLWIWIETIYHQQVQSGLPNNLTPLKRFQQDLHIIQPLGALAERIDDYFLHRIKRWVKKDGTLSWNNCLYEVPFQFAERYIFLVVEPHTQEAHHIESLDYDYLGNITVLDKHQNLSRQRSRPRPIQSQPQQSHLVETIYQKVKDDLDITDEE